MVLRSGQGILFKRAVRDSDGGDRELPRQVPSCWDGLLWLLEWDLYGKMQKTYIVNTFSLIVGRWEGCVAADLITAWTSFWGGCSSSALPYRDCEGKVILSKKTTIRTCPWLKTVQMTGSSGITKKNCEIRPHLNLKSTLTWSKRQQGLAGRPAWQIRCWPKWTPWPDHARPKSEPLYFMGGEGLDPPPY